MGYKVKRHHEGLRMKNGVKGSYIHTMDGKRIMMERIKKIDFIREFGGYSVVAVLISGQLKELFGSSDYTYCKKMEKKYKRELEEFKGRGK